MSSGRLQEVKNNKKALNFQAQNVVAVAYRRWSFTRNSNCKALTGKVLVFSIGGRLWEVVAPEGSTVSTTVEPRYNEVPRDSQNVFAITRFRYIEVLSTYFPITGVKKNRLLYRELRYIEVRYIEVSLY